MTIVKNKALRFLLFGLGVASVITGFIGIFLPLLPTTPFVLFAAWCFMRSSERAHNWIYQQPLLATTLINWKKERAISRRTKILAVSMILISIAVMSFKIKQLYILIPVVFILLCVSIFILTRKEGAVKL